MALFQSSVLKDHLRLQEEQQVDKAYKKLTAFFHNPEIQENIRSSKEEQFQATFLNELFGKVLGYTMNPQPGYELTTEFKNQKNARKADGAILKDGLAIGVIELKGTNTKHLEGIRQQAFDYKANQKGCVYVVTSNFEKLRFYINDATEFIEFDLFELTREDFSLLYLCLHKDNIFSHRPLKIKEASLVEEEVITKQFYKDYSVFKRELFRDLVLRNVDRIKNTKPPGYESDAQNFEADTKKQIRRNLFKKSQKLIDRFLFIFFAEDRGLLPPNSIHRIIADWNKLKDLDAETPLYKRFQLYFSYLDTGRKGTDKKGEIFAYNGGLFKPDPILDMIEIDDDLLYKHTARLATYDFESQVDVNILGHIFENSLNEIESVHAEIEGADFDKQKSKRKKDGVFYTPKYITKYIVENTVGRLCEEKKNELGFREEEYFKGRKRRHESTLQELLKILEDYRDWLLKLTICDPACGSGAFLNQALNFLIKEHRYIDELKHKLLGGGLVFSDIETTILENNIYGVDINEESVEIAKLSLWLRTAQPRRKLNDLSSNIKCGNSLIDDKKVAGNKAFKWDDEFPDVFAQGGFDVVIGNPPYVNIENLEERVKKHIFENYKTAKGRTDLFIAFVEKSFSIAKPPGLISFIIPFSITNQNYGERIREKIIKNHHIISIVDTSAYYVFSDAMVKTIILTMCNSRRPTHTLIHRSTEPILLEEKTHLIDQKKFLKLNKVVLETKPFENLLSIKEKVEISSIPLEKICLVAYGVRVNSKTEKTKPKSFYLHETPKEEFKPFVEGKNIERYYFTKYGYLDYQPSEHYNSMFPELFETEKLMFINVVSTRIRFAYDNAKHFNSHTVINCVRIDKLRDATHISARRIFEENNPKIAEKFNMIFLLTLLNSKLLNWYFLSFQSEGLHFYPDDAKKLPIFNIVNEEEQFPLIYLGNRMLKLSTEKDHLIRKFLRYCSKFTQSEIYPKTLQSWNQLDFSDFIKELNKAIQACNKERTKDGLSSIPQLTKKDEFEWMELFEENKQKALVLQREIEKTDKEIDRMIYKLYCLTNDEIEIIENSLN